MYGHQGPKFMWVHGADPKPGHKTIHANNLHVYEKYQVWLNWKHLDSSENVSLKMLKFKHEFGMALLGHRRFYCKALLQNKTL